MAEDSGMWVKVFPEYAGAGGWEGSPPAPILTNPEGGGVIAFTSGGEGDAGPTLAYGAEISPNDNGETVTVESDDPTVGGEVVVAGTTPYTDYVVKVFGVNVAGRGNAASTAAFQLNYNKAIGGDIEREYVADGKLWKQHVYQTEGTYTLNVQASVKDWTVRLIGRGGNSGYGDCPMDPPTIGGRAGYYEMSVGELPVQELEVIVGTNFEQGSPAGWVNESHSSSLETVGKAGGGGNGCRTAYCYACSKGDTGTWGGTSNALNGGSHPGKCNQHAPQGGGGADIGNAGLHTLWDGTTGNWGHHGWRTGCNDGQKITPPGSGLVAVTYEIGTATKAQIAADAERRRIIAESVEAGRLRGLSEAAEAYEQELPPELPELDAAIDKAFDE